jgi:dGTPase
MTCAWTDRLSSEDTPRRDDPRSPWQRDRARILHSAAFRRLQSKTQVLGIGDNDFYRTRLTHSLEVAQIGTGIISQLSYHQAIPHEVLPEPALIESLCLAHDIGHPPFGHGGEAALNYMMREHGGFEGNAQTFRILTKLEPYTRDFGMNLSRRTLLGVIKYPAPLSQVLRLEPPKEEQNFRRLRASDWHPPKGLYDDDQDLFDWTLSPLSSAEQKLFKTCCESSRHEHKKTRYKSFDCSIMELADDIAYGVHDLEDAIVMGMVNRHVWQENVASAIADIDDCWLADAIGTISDQLFSPLHHEQKDAIGALVNAFITSIYLEENPRFDEPLLRYQAVMSPPMFQALNIFKNYVLNYVVHTPEIEMVRYKGQLVVMELFEAFASDPMRLLPLNTRERWLQASHQNSNPQRVIADYIAGMTDGYAQKLSQTLF